MLVIAGVALNARADDLEPALAARARSLSGEALRDIGRTVRAVRHRKDPARITAIKQVLESRGLAPDSAGGKRWSWSEADHASLSRVVLRRVLATGESEPTDDEQLDAMRTRQNRLNRQQLLDRAAVIVAAFDEARSGRSAESLVPVRTGGTAVGFSDQSGATVSYLIRHRVVFRRYIGAVPVLGREGEIDVSFDLDGNVEELTVPASEYQLSADLIVAPATAVASRSKLERAFTTAGFERAPRAVGELLTRNGSPARIKSLDCGYYDDGQAPALTRGCVVALTTEQSADELFIPTEP